MTQTQFEDRLLAELRELVANQPGPVAAVRPTGRRRRPTRFVVGSVAATAVVAGLVLAATWSDNVSPAFAVDRQPDGSVTVTVKRLSDAQGLERQLRAAGIPAVVNYAPAGKACRGPGTPARVRGLGPVHAGAVGSAAPGQPTTFHLSRNMVPPGETLLMTASGANGPTSVGVAVVKGRVSSCTPVGVGTPPPGGGLSTGTDSQSLHVSP
jgi:hypothetical protein